MAPPIASVSLPDPRAPLDDAWYGSVFAGLDRFARERPSSLAVASSLERWSYGDLHARSNRLARLLQARGIGIGDIIAVCADRSPALVWALMGVLKAGAAFWILDRSHPPARHVDCLRQTEIAGWISTGDAPLPGDLIERLRQLPIHRCLELTHASDLLADFPAVNLDLPAGADDLACLTFTSGSTGRPKGILGRHGPLTHFVPWLRSTFDLSASDRFSMLSGLAYGPLQREIFTSLLTGASVHVPPPGVFDGPAELVDWLRQAAISVVHLTPALARLIATGCRGEAAPLLPALRLAFFAGEALRWSDVAALRALAPNVTIANGYGMTEVQRAASYFILPAGAPPPPPAAANGTASDTLPIGTGCRDVQILIMPNFGRLAGPGERGEIFLRTPHLAVGYLGDPALTRERFLVNPFTGEPGDRIYRTGDLGCYLPDGNVEYLGRVDDQVQIRGARVEPAEVEGALRRHPGVRDAVVVSRPDAAGDSMLLACVVRNPDAAATEPGLRHFLRARLPAPMWPSAFAWVDRFPLTPNGKIDRNALAALEHPQTPAASGRAAMVNDPEAALTRIWCRLLGRRRIGAGEGFFEAGGHSLAAARLVEEIERTWGVDLTVGDLFEYTTIRKQAALLRGGALGSRGETPVTLRANGSGSPLYLGHYRGGDVHNYRHLADYLGPDRPVYAFESPALRDRRLRSASMESLAEGYVEALLQFQAEGPYLLGGHSFGGLVALEMAQQLRAAGKEVRLLILLDTAGPGGSPRPLSPRKRVARRLTHLQQAALRERVAWLRNLVCGRTIALLRRAGIAQSVHAVAHRRYRVKPYGGPVLLVRGTDQRLSAADPTYGWSSLFTGPLDVCDVPGDHTSIVQPPDVREAAARLAAVLRQVDGH